MGHLADVDSTQYPLSTLGLPPGQAAAGDAEREPHRRGQPGHRRRGLSPGPCNLLLSHETHREIYIIYRIEIQKHDYHNSK